MAPSAASYPTVFSPLRIGPVEVRNRLYLGPHAVGINVPDPDLGSGFHLPAPSVADYYVERAREGVGLIVQGGTITHPTSRYPNLWHLITDRAVDAFAPVVDAVHEHGAKIFVQLMHAGNNGDPTGEYGGPLSASDVPGAESPPNLPVRRMSTADIEMVVESFAACAAKARRAGYDGVQLHGTHGYLIEQFLSPFWNRREDDYGGSVENRLRFLVEVLEAVRAVCGPDMAVGARLNCDEMLAGGLSSDDFRQMYARLDRMGLVDFMDLDVGNYHRFDLMVAPYQLPDGFQIEHIRPVRDVVKRAVVMAVPGRLHDPAVAEHLLVEGVLDLVGGVRGFIADPELARKAWRGKAREIRPCVGINACYSNMGCSINATGFREIAHGRTVVEPADVRRKVLVVGGGPAGLETARVAALRGHEVVLVERSGRLGGNINLAAAVPGREKIHEVIRWWDDRLADLGVEVRLGVEASPDFVAAQAADVVVIATGSRYDRSGSTGFVSGPVPGLDDTLAWTPEQVLTVQDRPGGTFVVLDEEGGTAGIGVSEFLAANGATVEYVTRWPAVAPFLGFRNWLPQVRRRLLGLGVRLTTSAYLKCVHDGDVVLFDIDTDVERTVENVTGVVLVTRRIPNAGLVEALASEGCRVEVVGDASVPRRIGDAVRDGFHLARSL
ncbi:FAD-dependent oxidoreductase [Pseudonocardia thermophila]|uniref:oxidoreductase n=1 Tax=Pseudonocardia thermophila TaxID=1848 RepID=UPI00248ED04E|nr:FAD-dependent oxidoreductase [Pseudonocardia thermophila]